MKDKAPRFEVQTELLSGWTNCWTDGEGTPETFATHAEAEEAIREHISDCIKAVDEGYMEDSPDPSSLRVVETAPAPPPQTDDLETYEAFIDYWNAVDVAMLKLFGIHTGEAGIEVDEIASAQEDGETPQGFALRCGEKHDLDTLADTKANRGLS